MKINWVHGIAFAHITFFVAQVDFLFVVAVAVFYIFNSLFLIVFFLIPGKKTIVKITVLLQRTVNIK